MATFKGHGLRGSTLEEIINRTNECYAFNGLALIQKIPTPITPVEMNAQKQITLAYFDSKSTVDYIGAVQGIPVCFDAKELKTDTFPLHNIHEHQIEFMDMFEKQGGISFIIAYYTHIGEMYYIPYQTVRMFWDRMLSGGRKSFRIEEIDKTYRVRSKGEYLCHYLEPMNLDLSTRE